MHWHLYLRLLMFDLKDWRVWWATIPVGDHFIFRSKDTSKMTSLLFSIQSMPRRKNTGKSTWNSNWKSNNTRTSNYFYSDEQDLPRLWKYMDLGRSLSMLNSMIVKTDIENKNEGWPMIGGLHNVCLIGWAHRLHMNDVKNVSPWLRGYWTQQGERERNREREKKRTIDLSVHTYIRWLIT